MSRVRVPSPALSSTLPNARLSVPARVGGAARSSCMVRYIPGWLGEPRDARSAVHPAPVVPPPQSLRSGGRDAQRPRRRPRPVRISGEQATRRAAHRRMAGQRPPRGGSRAGRRPHRGRTGPGLRAARQGVRRQGHRRGHDPAPGSVGGSACTAMRRSPSSARSGSRPCGRACSPRPGRTSAARPRAWPGPPSTGWSSGSRRACAGAWPRRRCPRRRSTGSGPRQGSVVGGRKRESTIPSRSMRSVRRARPVGWAMSSWRSSRGERAGAST